MLPQRRRRACGEAWRPGKAHGDAQESHRPQHGMRDRGQRPVEKRLGSTSISGTDRTRVHGTSASAKRASHSPAVRAASRSVMVRISSALCAWRPTMVWRRGSSSQPSSPSVRQRPARELRELDVHVQVAVARGVDPRDPVAEEIAHRLGRLLRLGPERAAGLHREHAVQERGFDPLAGAASGARAMRASRMPDYRQAPRVVVHEASAHEFGAASPGPRLAPRRGRHTTARPDRVRGARPAGRFGRMRTPSSR